MQQTIDTSGLARAGSELHGQYPLAQLQRLESLLADRDGSLAWRLRGWRERAVDGVVQDFMALSIAANLQMSCVRCNAPVAVVLSIEREYRLVRSEAEAERLDLDDRQYDVLCGGRRFDLAGLVEDEAIMALPAMPRHERCELPAPAAAAAGAATPGADSERARPFAALERLKNGAQNTDMIEN